MAKEENRTSHSDAISVTVLLSGKAAHPQAMTAAAAAMTRAMVTSNLRLQRRLWEPALTAELTRLIVLKEKKRCSICSMR